MLTSSSAAMQNLWFPVDYVKDTNFCINVEESKTSKTNESTAEANVRLQLSAPSGRS